MIFFTRLMLAAFRFELAVSQDFMGIQYKTKLRQDIAKWEAILDRESINGS